MDRSNYKRLGDYIATTDVRNRDLNVSRLLGVSVDKTMFPSIANTIGTDFSTYKILYPGQFVYIPDTSRRGDKIAISLLSENEKVIVSSAYTTFEVLDTNKLHPEYLMMWFRRPEFDRYARFKSNGSAREIFSWDEMCEVYLPVPDIATQRRIVAEYQAIEKRIATNEQLIAKLEETAQTIYKKMFVEDINPEHLPNGWHMGNLSELGIYKNGKVTSPENGNIPIYGGNGVIGYKASSNFEKVIVVGRVGINCGCLHIELGKCWVNDNAIAAIPKDAFAYLYWTMVFSKLNEKSEGSSQPLITQTIINNTECVIPSKKSISDFDDKAMSLIRFQIVLKKENDLLRSMQELVLSQMAM